MKHHFHLGTNMMDAYICSNGLNKVDLENNIISEADYGR